jgi:transcriptional regulator with GAF, ATPase, and Fis domain
MRLFGHAYQIVFKEVKRVRNNELRPVEVMVVAASNRDLSFDMGRKT